MRFIRYLIVALGCLLWMLPLAGALDRIQRFGIFEEAAILAAISTLMILLTAGVALVPPTHRAFGGALAGATIAAFVAGLYCLGIWGADV